VGTYLVTVAAEAAPVAASVATSVAYSAEYGTLTPDRSTLERISAITGGSVLDEVPEDLFAPAPGSRGQGRAVTGILLALALLLFACDIVVRLATVEMLVALLRRDHERGPGGRLSYDEVRRQIDESRHAEARRVRDFSFWFGKERVGEEEGPQRLHVPRRRGG
jgi:hypothetical protein